MNQYRKCKATIIRVGKSANGARTTEKEEVCGLFHQWGSTYEEFENGAVAQTVAIIELQDGRTIEAAPEAIQFIDGAQQYRPCTVKGQRARFHRWEDMSKVAGPSMMIGGSSGGEVRAVFAIVELEDGKVAEAYPHDVKFTDGPGGEDALR